MRPPEDFGLDEIVRFLMTTMRNYDVRHVSKSYMSKLYPSKEVYGLVNLEKRKIYLRNSLLNGDHDRIFLHELAHVYKDGLIAEDIPEDEIWKLSGAWLKTIYGMNK